MKDHQYSHFWSLLLLFWILGALSCRKEETGPLTPLSEGNQWILDSMRVYYYWNDQLPARPAPDPDARQFLSGLLHPADRFSYLLDPDHPLTAYSSFAYYGLEYAFTQVKEAGDRWVGIVTLAVPGGSAAAQGLKRGDMFTAVNGRELTPSSADALHQLLKEGKGVTLKTVRIENGTLQEVAGIMLPPTHFTEQPVYLAKVFTTEASNTGYLFYNYFDGRFDQQLLDSLYKLKQAGIRNLILDLRYNPGGDVSSAALIGAVVAPVQADEQFVTYKANRNGGIIQNTFQDALDDAPYQRYTFDALLPYRLNLEKLIILTTASTASAAELLVNNLSPYMTVIQIGGKTMGKDMASFAISDQRPAPKVNYTLYPLVFKLYNAAGKGDYSAGLTPGILADEFSRLPLRALGDENDVLIEQALEKAGGRIAGKVLPGRPSFTSSEARSRFFPPIIKKR
ncbi:S41 family peptidase [Chitinophaga pinensis]|uniref:PDZ domain-containing protein n=1 Tax=Chitinophaga pinensis TaxID=79329 RepID=A0A5C6LKU1_9BACT|nr:S41 family peptidase [Chitinophaga pinensis]TWV96291.1 hypothetical protein FEF09_23265 [Chitinophaga pinensis]